MDEHEEHSNEDNSNKRACPWPREILVPKRLQGPRTGQEQEPGPQLMGQRRDQRPAQQIMQSSGQFSAGERTSATSPISIPIDVPVFKQLPVFTNGQRPAHVPAPPSSKSVPIPLQIPPPIFVDPQEPERCAIWEFVVIFRLVRGSEVCLPCQDMILDFISNDAGASCHGGNCRPRKPGYPLPPGFNRHYLDYLVDGDSESDPYPEHIPHQSPCPRPPPPAPARPPRPALSPQMVNLALDVDGRPKDPLPIKKVRSEEPHSSGTCPQSGSLPSHPHLNHQRTTANLPTPITTPTMATPSPSPAPSTGTAPFTGYEERKTKTKTAITPTMYLHYRSFRSIIRVIEAQAKIWITTRPDHFRETLHTRWMLGLPEELALKLWLACQGRYTLLDLATGREFPASRTADGRYEHGTAYPYMAMIRRYLVAVANVPRTTCACPGAGWYQPAVAKVTFDAVLTAVPTVTIAGATSGPSGPSGSNNNTHTTPDGEKLLNQQINRFLTSTPSPVGPYIDPRITTILSGSISPQGQAKLTQLDWMSLAFPHPTLQLSLLVLSYIGRLAVHGVLRTLYQDLQTLYNEVEPLPAIPPLMNTCMNTNRNRNTGLKPFKFEKCALYLEMQLSSHSWGIGAEAKETVSKDLRGSILGNQPWDWPSSWKGPRETVLQGPAEEVREALGFLVSGALHWVRVRVRVDV